MCGALTLAVAQPAAETPFVPDEWKFGRRQEGFTHNDGAREAVSHARKIARLTHTERVATEAAAPAK